MRVLFAWLLMVGYVSAGGAEAIITGETEADQYEWVVLDSSTSTGDHRHWMVDTSEVAVPDDDGPNELSVLIDRLRQLGVDVDKPKEEDGPQLWLSLRDGEAIIIGHYPGTYRVYLAVSDADGIDATTHNVVREGRGPGPPRPEPGPKPPTPVPPVPGLGIKEAVSTAISSVASPESTDEFALLANVYGQMIIGLIDAGHLTTAENIESTTRVASLEVIGEYRDDWVSVIETALVPALSRLDLAEQLRTPAHYRVVWLEISAGIKEGIQGVQ